MGLIAKIHISLIQSEKKVGDVKVNCNFALRNLLSAFERKYSGGIHDVHEEHEESKLHAIGGPSGRQFNPVSADTKSFILNRFLDYLKIVVSKFYSTSLAKFEKEQTKTLPIGPSVFSAFQSDDRKFCKDLKKILTESSNDLDFVYQLFKSCFVVKRGGTYQSTLIKNIENILVRGDSCRQILLITMRINPYAENSEVARQFDFPAPPNPQTEFYLGDIELADVSSFSRPRAGSS